MHNSANAMKDTHSFPKGKRAVPNSITPLAISWLKGITRDLTLDSQPISTIELIGRLYNLKISPNLITFSIEDGSGSIDLGASKASHSPLFPPSLAALNTPPLPALIRVFLEAKNLNRFDWTVPVKILKVSEHNLITFHFVKALVARKNRQISALCANQTEPIPPLISVDSDSAPDPKQEINPGEIIYIEENASDFKPKIAVKTPRTAIKSAWRPNSISD